MSYDLVGRWQTRLSLFLLVGLPAALLWQVIAVPPRLWVAPAFLASWLAVGLVADIGWDAVQRRRAEGDWPPLFTAYGLGLEALVVFALVRRGLVPLLPPCLAFEEHPVARILTCVSPTLTSAGAVGLGLIVAAPVWLLAAGGLTVLLPGWRARRGRLVSRPGLAPRPARGRHGLPKFALPILALMAAGIAAGAGFWLAGSGVGTGKLVALSVSGAAAGLVAAASGLSAGLLLLPGMALARDSGLLPVGFASLSDLLNFATLAGVVGASVAWRANGRRAASRLSARAVACAVGAGGVPVALLAHVAASPVDRVAATVHIIAALVLGVILVVLAFAARAGHHEEDGLEPSRPVRGDWWVLAGIGAFGAYIGNHLPFGTAELVAIYLLSRNFSGSDVAPAALAASVPGALVIAAQTAVDGFADLTLALALVPSVFLVSLAGARLARHVDPVVATAAASVWIVAASLVFILRALG